MKRRRDLGISLLVFSAGLVGCEQPAGSPNGATRVATPPGVIRAEDATGVWSQSQVEQYLKEDLKLTQLSLTSAGGDNYTGTGKTADGRTLQLKVRQVPGGIACDFEDERGGAGRISFGNPVPEE